MAAAIIAVLTLALVVMFQIGRSGSTAVLEAIPLATEAGTKAHPTFSPDSNHVAYSWNGDKQENFDIYVKLIGATSALRLTKDPANEFFPSWSPNGQSIAFLRDLPEARTAVLLIPPLGGPERKVGEKFGGESICWSPDGNWLYIEDRAGYWEAEAIFALSVETGEKRRLTNPGFRGDRDPAISPDGRTLAFVRYMPSGIADVYLLPLRDGTPVGEPRRVTFEGRVTSRPVWTPDGKELIVVDGPTANFHLSRLFPDGQHKTQRMAVGEMGDTPAVSARSARLAYSKVIRDANIWRVDLPSRPGELARPVEFISSSRLDFNPQYGPNGDRIVFSSNRTGSFEIWTANTEGSGLIQLTSFGGPQVGSPRWSPDQQQIVFDCNIGGESRIYTVGAQGGKPQIVPDTGPAVVPSWSRDGNWIYYGSNRTGRFEVWRAPAKGGPPVQITRNGGFVAYESWDAQTLYYAKTDGPAPVFRMSLASNGAASGAGEESQVLEGVPYRAWAVTASGL